MNRDKLKVGCIAEVITPKQASKKQVKHVFKVGAFVVLTRRFERLECYDCHIFGRTEAKQIIHESELQPAKGMQHTPKVLNIN